MRQIYSFAIFISVILLISFSINFYVLSRLCGLFGIKRSLAFWAIVFVCTVSFIGATIFQSFAGNIISRIVYITAANWLGILWLLFSTLIVYEILRLFLKVNSSVAGILIITIVALATIYSMINAQLVRVKRLTIPGNVDSDIVQLSDIHIGSTGGGFLKRIIEKTNALEPDLILITGDLVDNYNKRTRKALELLENFEAPVLFVTGNHENYVGPAKVAKSLAAANIKVLRNQRTDYGKIRIIGIDDNTNEENLERILRELNTDNSKFCILMYHRPVELKTLCEAGVNLTLSGHTHAGQIFPFNYVVGLFYKYLSGLHKYENSYLYVTTGAGTWGPRMRLGSKNEIVLVKIRKTF